MALEKTYDRSVVDATRKGSVFTITTKNVRLLNLNRAETEKGPFQITIDGQAVKVPQPDDLPSPAAMLQKVDGKWVITDLSHAMKNGPYKGEMLVASLQGPIDDAFTGPFKVVRPGGTGWSDGADKYAAAALRQFERVWDKYFHGTLAVVAPEKIKLDAEIDPNATTIPDVSKHLVLFGDPQSNPLIAKALPKLPITWTKDELVVNGVKYDAKTHLPVLIYPNPLSGFESYVVINSGHTFKEVDLKGTNALLYPRLGDWAVIKPTPTEKDPAAYEVVAAGLFDENWQFPKK
jgi:hypothetical protein